MWINHISQNVSRPSDYDTLVASSHDTYSVIHWLAGDRVIRLDRTGNGIYQYYTDEDTDYFYEYYEYGGTNMCTCLRASKHPTGSDTDIYAHKMATYDFYGVFNSNLKDPRIYSWHGNDECPSYYWHGYGDGTVDIGWCIENDLPFKFEFAERATSFDDYPDWIWHKVADELPYKVMFPTRYPIDDAPEAMWKITNSLPFKSTFARLYHFDDAPLAIWKKYPGEIPFKVMFPPMPPPPKMEGGGVYEAEREIILLSDYRQTVILRGYRQRIVIDDIEL